MLQVVVMSDARKEIESFVGKVRRQTPGVPVGSSVRIERHGTEGWHLPVTTYQDDAVTVLNQWDVWADHWPAVLEWLVEWDIEIPNGWRAVTD